MEEISARDQWVENFVERWVVVERNIRLLLYNLPVTYNDSLREWCKNWKAPGTIHVSCNSQSHNDIEWEAAFQFIINHNEPYLVFNYKYWETPGDFKELELLRPKELEDDPKEQKKFQIAISKLTDLFSEKAVESFMHDLWNVTANLVKEIELMGYNIAGKNLSTEGYILFCNAYSTSKQCDELCGQNEELTKKQDYISKELRKISKELYATRKFLSNSKTIERIRLRIVKLAED